MTPISILNLISSLLLAIVVSARPLLADGSIKIGLIAPLSGSMAHVGSASRDAALMAVDELRSAGIEIKLLAEDDQLSSRLAANAANRLINIEHVDGIISTWSYGGSVVSPIADKAKTPHFGVAWDPTIARGDLNFLHLTPPSEFIPLFLQAFKDRNLTSVAAFGIEESGSLFALEELKRLAPEYGIEITSSSILSFSETDLRSVVQRATASNPRVIFANLPSPLIEQLMAATKQLKFHGEITSITGFDVISDLSLAEGLWYVSDSYLNPDFSAKFKKNYGHSITYGVGNYYDAVKLISWMIRGARENKISYSDQLQSISEFKSIFGPLRVSPDGIIHYRPTYLQICHHRRQVAGAGQLTCP